MSSGNFLPLRQRFPFFGILIAAIVGILLAEWLGESRWVVLILIAAWLVLLPLRRYGSHCWILTAACFALLQLWNWQEAPARRLATLLDGKASDFSVQGIVDGEPRISSHGSCSFPLRLESLEELSGPSHDRLACRAPMSVEVRWPGPAPLYGDRVSFIASALRPALPRNPGVMDYRRWLERHAIYSEFRIDPSSPGTIVSSGHGNPVRELAIRARHRMEQILAIDLPGTPEVLGVIRGITLGVTEHTPEGFTDDFRFTGTMHLFAVSGLHVGMLAVIIWFVLRTIRLPQRLAIVLTIPALFFYVLVTGMKMGSIRSAVMASILLCGLALYRRSPLINTLAVAAVLQLACDPNALFSAGWQFSYSVVFAILLLAGPLEFKIASFCSRDPFLPAQLLTRGERLGFAGWRHFSGLAAVSAAAWVGALIPTIAYFHLISFSAFGANLLAVPLAFGVLSLGSISLLAGIISPWIAGAFNNTNWLLAKLLLLIVQVNALLPGGHWFIGSPASASPVMTILDLHGGSCAVIRDGHEFALIDAGRKRDAYGVILPCLESLGANSIRSCLITKPDASHLGGLPTVKKEFRVSKVLLAKSSTRSLTGRGILSALTFTALCPGKEIPLTERVSVKSPCDLGETSSSLRVSLGETRVLILTQGDAESLNALSRLQDEEIRAEVVIMPLGDAEFVSTISFLERVRPKAVIAPIDSFKRHGIPSLEWSQLLAGKGIALYRQDDCGAVMVAPTSSGPLASPFLQQSWTSPLSVLRQ